MSVPCLSSEEKERLRHVLLGNADVFAWSHLGMAGEQRGEVS